MTRTIAWAALLGISAAALVAYFSWYSLVIFGGGAMVVGLGLRRQEIQRRRETRRNAVRRGRLTSPRAGGGGPIGCRPTRTSAALSRRQGGRTRAQGALNDRALVGHDPAIEAPSRPRHIRLIEGGKPS
jgi:hypothetical protein